MQEYSIATTDRNKNNNIPRYPNTDHGIHPIGCRLTWEYYYYWTKVLFHSAPSTQYYTGSHARRSSTSDEVIKYHPVRDHGKPGYA